MKYTHILWDVDNTLLDFNKSEAASISECFKHHGLYVDEQIISRYSAINDSFWKRLEKGEITKQDVLYGRFKQLFEELQITGIDIPQFQKVYEYNLGHIWFYKEDSFSLVQQLKKQGYKQYIITNGTVAVQNSKLGLSGFDKLMDGIFISDEIGVQKPAKGFFDAAFKVIGEENRKNCVVIGDSLSSDMKGAAIAGLDSIWYRPADVVNQSQIEVTYEIDKLNDVMTILEGNYGKVKQSETKIVIPD